METLFTTGRHEEVNRRLNIDAAKPEAKPAAKEGKGGKGPSREDHVARVRRHLDSIFSTVGLEFESPPKHFAAGEPIAVRLSLKNVPSVACKIYKINTEAFYAEHKQEVPDDLELGGLMPNEVPV